MFYDKVCFILKQPVYNYCCVWKSLFSVVAFIFQMGATDFCINVLQRTLRILFRSFQVAKKLSMENG